MRRKLTDKYFEDLSVGDKFLTPSRTITEADLVMFNNLTWDTAPLHNDKEFVRTHPSLQANAFQDRLVPSSFLIGLCAGLECQTDLHFGRGLALLGLEAQFFAPVYPGDTVYSEVEVVEARESRSKPDRGIVKYTHTLRNQDDVKICEVTRTHFQERRPPAEHPAGAVAQAPAT